MAPRPTAQRRSNAQSEAFHELGVRGRKTGVSLKDTGVRDEHGMQPLDDVFSSPDKDSQDGAEYDDEEEEDSDEEPMDIDETTGPAPSAFMNGNRFPPARARSPLKTHLQSPAKRNPHLGHSSSPTRGSIVRHSLDGSSPKSSPRGKAPQRKLDFSNKPSLAKTNGVNGKGKAAAATNGHLSPDEEEEEEESHQPDEESMAMLDGNDDYAVDDEEEPEANGEPGADEEPEVDGDETEEEEPAPVAPKSRGRPKKASSAKSVEEEEPIVQSIEEEAGRTEENEPARVGKKRGRPPKNKDAEEDTAEQSRTKKARPSPKATRDTPQSNGQKATGASQSKAASKASAPTKKPAIPKQRRAAKPRTSTGVGDTSVAEIPRGPPLPKSRGLMITRRETPDGFTTRSGRTSYQPLKFWRNERVELDGDEVIDDGKQHVLLPRIKEIVRIDDPEPDPKASRRKAGRPAGKKGGKRGRGRYDSEDDDNNAELEPWEQDGDIITGEVVVWQPEHEFNPPGPDEQIEVAEEQLAVSAGAIVTHEIRHASFRFAKTLSTPFFGAGVVDLPPHSEKKPKNARKMHMSFFVFSGRVQVTVADTTFSIGKGGMWFVPRGNYYSIENDYDQPARIMFSQGCEVSSAAVGEASMVG
ncbi:Centromere protein 3 [Cytospora mali]|uniref:CENP-C homolog n=1 Tax=Cytospora mali TaxID=578113 RepID=A0A194V9X8_CYTMA|nr:Centromere protein 3 [Valsa mali var. pyri (nom. inval.)]